MKVAVLGATGRTGRIVVNELLGHGHDVAALVRDPERLGDARHLLRVVTGVSRDRTALTELVGDADGVISTLGPTGKDHTLHRDTAAVLIPVMRQAGVRRFIGVSGAGIDVPGDHKSIRDKVISKVIQTVGGELVADKPAEYQLWAASDRDWTLVRPPRLVNGPPTRVVAHDAHRSTRSTKIRRTDLAAFLVDVFEHRLYQRQAPFVANA